MKINLLFLMVIGAICGMFFFQSDGGFWLGALLGWIIGEQLRLLKRFDHIEQRLSALITTNNNLVTTPNNLVTTPNNVVDTPVISPVSFEFAIKTEPTVIAPISNLRQRLWSLIVGENPLARVGVVLLFFGVAFLFKYIAASISISLEWRFIATTVLGLGLLGVGWHLRERRPGYAMIVQGGGVGIWYLTVFVAIRFGLVPIVLAFPLLVALSIFAALLALGQNSSALALFGTVGGYLAPVLITTQGGNHVQLFSYYALLNAGVLGLAWFKTWRSLNIVGFIFTFTISGLWEFSRYQSSYFATTEPFLILFFLMYVAVAVLFALRQPPRLQGLVDGGLVFGLPAVAAGLQAVLVRHLEFGMAWSALALGGFYLGLSAWLWQREGARLRLLCESFLALGVVCTTLTIPLAVDGRWTAAAWSLEGAALIWIGVRQGRVLARVSGSLLQIIAGWFFIFSGTSSSSTLPVFNVHGLGGILMAFAGIFSALQLDYYHASLRFWERPLKGLLLGWGLLWWYVTGIHEIERFVPLWVMHAALLLFITFSAVMSIVLRQPLKSRLIAIPAWLLLPAMGIMRSGIYWLFFLLIFIFFPFLPFWREIHDSLPNFQLISPPWLFWWSAWLLAFIVQYWGLWRLDSDFPNTRMRNFWHMGTLWMLAWVVAGELNNLVMGLNNGSVNAWNIIAWGMVPAGLAWWVMEYGSTMARWPFDVYREIYLQRGAGGLLVFAWGWALYANIASDGMAWPLLYLPVVNPLDLALIFVMLTLTRWWAIPRASPIYLQRQIIKVFAISIFFILNGIVARTVHHWDGVPYQWHALFASSTLQSSLSLLWSMLALTVMAIAARRSWRYGWIVGAVLLTVVVAKLFIIELVNHGTLARIISFLGVGTLLLIIGYLAPLPRKMVQELK